MKGKTVELRELYDEVGGDYDQALSVYRKDDKILRYLKIMFKSDSATNLSEAIEAKDGKACFMAAHALKGTTSSMALTGMASRFSEIADLTRDGEFDEAVIPLFAEAEPLYRTLENAILNA